MRDAYVSVDERPNYGSVIEYLSDWSRPAYACRQWSWNGGQETADVRYYVSVWDRHNRSFYWPVCTSAEEAVGLAGMLNG